MPSQDSKAQAVIAARNVEAQVDTPASGSRSSKRTRIRRHPERAVPELAEEILLAGRVAHVAFAVDGQPYVLPFVYHYAAGKLYLHGAYASRTMKVLQAGTPVCVEVTLLDGLVASRTAKDHSMNYRSVVVFGTAEDITDEGEKRRVFEEMTARIFPGRASGADYAPARTSDLRTTRLMAITIEDMSAKRRAGPPTGRRDNDSGAAGSCFVLPLASIDA